MIARKNTMTPSTSENLDRFISAFNERKSYLLSYAVVKEWKNYREFFREEKNQSGSTVLML